MRLLRETIIVLIVSIILYFVVTFAFDKKHEKIMKNCFYSYAYVTKVYKYGELSKGSRYNGASLPMVDFYYEINGHKYYAKRTITNTVKVVEKGDKYLLIVSKEDIEKNILMFNYLIKDSVDFKRYVEEFEQRRKQKE